MQKRNGWLVLALIVIAGFVLRIGAASGDLWFDEIWSIEISQMANTNWEVITRLKHDNNHLLNTLVIRQLGPSAPEIAYRLPVVICGTLSIVIGFLIGRRQDLTCGLWSAGLIAFSHFLVHYSSESRGYGYAVLFALWSQYCLMRLLDLEALRDQSTKENSISNTDLNPNSDANSDSNSVLGSDPIGRANPIQFAILIAGLLLASAAGVLSHLTYVMVLVTQISWCGVQFYYSRIDTKSLQKIVLVGLAAPLLFFAWLWKTNYSGMETGGGDPTSLLGVIAMTPISFAGGVTGGWMDWVDGIVFGLLIAGAIRYSFRSQHPDVFFEGIFLATLLTFIVAGVVVTFSGLLYPRYFTVLLPFIWLWIARWISSINTRPNRLGKVNIPMVLGLALIGLNMWPNIQLIRIGRGGYSDVVDYITEHDPSETILIGTDHEGRTSAIVDFYLARQSAEPRRYKIQTSQFSKPTWFIQHSFDSQNEMEPSLVSPNGTRYEKAIYRSYWGLSGWSWGAFRRESQTQ